MARKLCAPHAIRPDSDRPARKGFGRSGLKKRASRQGLNKKLKKLGRVPFFGEGSALSQDLESRIESLYRSDRLVALIFVAALWVVLVFVMLAVREHITNGAVEIVCWISLLALGLFNTASIIAMIRHYAHDKQHIYSIDIKHQDAGR